MTKDEWDIWIVLVFTGAAIWLIVCFVAIWADHHLGEKLKKALGLATSNWMFICKCGHPKSNHNGSSGPYSNRRYHHGECTHGCKSIPPYRVGGCNCYEYKRLFFPRYRRAL